MLFIRCGFDDPCDNAEIMINIRQRCLVTIFHHDRAIQVLFIRFGHPLNIHRLDALFVLIYPVHQPIPPVRVVVLRCARVLHMLEARIPDYERLIHKPIEYGLVAFIYVISIDDVFGQDTKGASIFFVEEVETVVGPKIVENLDECGINTLEIDEVPPLNCTLERIGIFEAKPKAGMNR